MVGSSLCGGGVSDLILKLVEGVGRHPSHPTRNVDYFTSRGGAGDTHRPWSNTDVFAAGASSARHLHVRVFRV